MSVFYLINWHVDLFIWVSCIMMFPAPMGLKTWDSSGCHMTNHYTVSQIYKRMFEKKHFHDRNVLLSLIYFYKSINLSLLNLSLWDNLSKSSFFNSFFFCFQTHYSCSPCTWSNATQNKIHPQQHRDHKRHKNADLQEFFKLNSSRIPQCSCCSLLLKICDKWIMMILTIIIMTITTKTNKVFWPGVFWWCESGHRWHSRW